MTERLNIALAQLNPTVGNLSKNTQMIKAAYEEAKQLGAHLMVTAEMVLTGYPLEDLVKKPAFQDAVEKAVEDLLPITEGEGPGLVLGTSWRMGSGLFNALLMIENGEITAVRAKHDLPNYGVFDEKRLFDQGTLRGPVEFRGFALGLMVCEDMWFPDVTECLEETGAEILISANGSPFEHGKIDTRMNYAVARVTESNLPLIYVNQVGGQDELLFDGGSFILQKDCALAGQMMNFQESVALSVWERTDEGLKCVEAPQEKPVEDMAALYGAMVLGLRDYVEKNGFPGVLLGLSGGIDSALSVAAAVDALGKDRVYSVMMPSPYTSQESLDDAADVAKKLDIKLDEVSIGPAMAAFEEMLNPIMEDGVSGITAENIQSRSRGLTLMALSNAKGYMLLTTGNKSEMAVGYATLYGDMCGGYSVLKDIYKTNVFKMCHWRNEGVLPSMKDLLKGPDGPVMPERVISKPPSAELRPDQKDEDSLPPYPVLDDILECLVEEEMSVEDVEQRGHDRDTILKVWNLLDLTEYKRRQAPPGVKLTSRAFGRDRRYPITNGFRRLLWQ